MGGLKALAGYKNRASGDGCSGARLFRRVAGQKESQRANTSATGAAKKGLTRPPDAI